MRVKEKRKPILKSIYEFIEKFTAVDYPDGEEINISKSKDQNMKALKDSLNNNVGAIEMKYFGPSSSNNSNPKGGMGNNIVDRAEVDNNKAMRQAENRRVEQQEKSQEQVERGR